MRLKRRVAARGAAIGRTVLRRAGLHKGGVGGFGQDDLRFRPFLPQHTRDAGHGAASAIARDEVIQPLAFEIGHDLPRRGGFVDIGIGGGFELTGKEPAIRLGQFLGLGIHAIAFQCARRQHHLGAQKPHQPPPLHRETVGHRHHQRIALGGADHGKADAGIARCRLDHRLAGGKLAVTFRRLDDVQRQAVLDRGGRVERLGLHIDGRARWRDPVDADDGRIAHGVEDGGVALATPVGRANAHVSSPPYGRQTAASLPLYHRFGVRPTRQGSPPVCAGTTCVSPAHHASAHPA